MVEKKEDFVLIDVRGEDEVRSTGPLTSDAVTLPLPDIMNMALGMDPDDFEDRYGFPKPDPSATLVFSCKAGVRSDTASQIAVESGYIKVINYTGGADDWFHAPPDEGESDAMRRLRAAREHK